MKRTCVPRLRPGLLPLWAAILVLFGAPETAGAQPITLQAAVEQALKHNVAYQSALLAVDQARNALSDGPNWKSIGVSATQKQSSDPKSPASTNVGVTFPVWDQLGASASIDQTGAAQVSVTASPLVHSDTAVQARIAYEKAELAADQARITLEVSVRKAVLAQSAAQAQREVQRRTTALKQTAYQDAKARFDKGTVTLTEVRAALKDWTDAQSAQTTADRTLVKARSDLAGLLQTETVELVPLDSAAVEGLVTALGPVGGAPTSVAVRVQALEVESQQAKADAVWWLDPGLSIVGGAVLPSGGTPTWSGSVTLSLSLGSWQGSDRALADRSVALARQSLAAQTTAARAAQSQGLLAVEAAQSAVASRRLALTQAQDLLQETQLLQRAGKATALDVDDAALGVTSAENDLFQAWADLYGARLDLAAGS